MKRFPLSVSLVCVLLLFMTGAPACVAVTTTTATTITPSYMVTYGDPTLTSIIPWTGATNTTTGITLAGTNFRSAAGFRLKQTGSKEIAGSVSSVNSTHIVGTVNLYNQPPGEYQVCVYNSPSIYVCGLTFTVTPPAEAVTAASIFFETNPTGATVWLNGTNNIGTTVFTYYNATPGTYKVVIKKSGYEDYTGSVTVLEGKRVRFIAPLTPHGAGTTAVTATPVKTATIIQKSTLKVPTSWPSDTPTEESPVDPATALGAAGIAVVLVMIRRR
jgi:hypothetical protein